MRYLGSEYAKREEIVKRGLVSFEGIELKDSLDPLGVVIRFDTSMAYVARRTNDSIDMSAVGLDWRNWWKEIEGNSEMVLDEKKLYLLGSQGAIGLNAACGIISKEMRVFNGVGGFGCLAGIIQPGFFGEITMESYFNSKTQIRTGDVAGCVLVDPVVGKVPESDVGNYDGGYQGQCAPRLPKMFDVKKD